MKQRNPYLFTVFGLYLNYVFQGIAAIIISQNKTYFLQQWHTSIEQLYIVLAAIGLGRIMSLTFSGWLSDHFGRRLAMYIGVLSYVVFYVGLFLSPTYQLACLVAIFGGFGNAFLDTSTYPIVMEAFQNGERNQALSILNKAFISIGQMVFPFVLSIVMQYDIPMIWVFAIPTICLLLNLLFLMGQPFPERIDKQRMDQEKDIQKSSSQGQKKTMLPKGQMRKEGAALLIFSFVSVSLFNIFITSIPLFGEQLLGMSESKANIFVSYYSFFSLISVFVTSFLISRGMPVMRWMIICLTLTGLALVTMILLPSFWTVMLATFAVGFFAAGGIWQLGLVVMLDFFSSQRGLNTSFYSLSTSISVMVIPYLTGVLAKLDIVYVFWLNALLALIGLLSILFVAPSYQRLLQAKRR
ncbi:MFS transporter [Streptococcus sp. DD13]|uniref:MFS transporter n=1 Tax=Streptococcus sp. DD13 TaxID=1777881 RepID=UPI0007924716|nr:MFS transporter [Streptococcus sp. DD13]KXT79075.1 putative transport system permease protein [Streptococcus sp. DD13]